MDLEIITLTEINQTKKYYGRVISELIYKTGTDSQTQKINGYQRGREDKLGGINRYTLLYIK